MFNHPRRYDYPIHGNGNIYYGSHNSGRRPYGFFRFMFDLVMVTITGGFWLIWIFIREMRAR